MVFLQNLALAASALLGIAAALPADLATRQTYVPGTQNNTQEFYLTMKVTDGPTTYDGYGGMWPLPLLS